MAVTEREADELREQALTLHRQARGKIEVHPRVPVRDSHDLSLAYTPGVAEPCKEIHDHPELVYEYTGKGNMVAVVTDGTAVLGLGDIGPQAALPVMEGKSVLFKTFAGVNAVPICLATKEVARIVETVKLLAPNFGGVNLEDISAPRCFEIESRLRQEVDIPVFHDDQHGTAIVTAAALINALKLVGKALESVRIVVNGAGAAGVAITQLLLDMGARDVVLCDRAGAIWEGRSEDMNPYKLRMAAVTNPRGVRGGLDEAVRGADVFIGVSSGGVLTPEMVRSMAAESIVMAMANPVPEIYPDEARQAGARVVATGRSDFPNQINNSLVFPGVFRGALDVRASQITEHMKRAAAEAIAALVAPDELREEYIIPSMWNAEVAPAVAAAVAAAAVEDGVARVERSPGEVAQHTRDLVAEARRQEG
ncbi:MAG: NAD-dependent malic enzyme [Clostridia bacterium]|nr:NAD-dependent malic enzyme [Clostridia bacterium]MCL6521778.1 NAD-dependent malic enzyme [Bacillota bacterium]